MEVSSRMGVYENACIDPKLCYELAKPSFTQRRYTRFSELLRSSEASSQKFSEYIQNGCLKEAKTIQNMLLRPRSGPKKVFG